MSDAVVEFPALTQAQEKLDAKRKALSDVLSESGPEYDMAQVKSLQGDTHAKVAEIGKMNSEIDDAKKKVDELMVVARAAATAKEEDSAASASGEKGSDTGPQVKDRKRKSIGDQIVDSPAFKDFKRGTGPTAHLDLELKTLFQTSAGWDPEDLRSGRVEMTPQRPAPHVADFLPQTTTGQSAVVYMEESTYTNNAAERAEGASYAEAALALSEKSSTVRSVAVFLPVTEEQFEDEERARGYVENRLPFMIRQRLDLQVLSGDGVSPNLLGTENVTGIQTQSLGTDPIPDAIYKAARKIRDDGFAEPSAVFIRPSKWESVRLLKTSDGVYIWGHPSMPGPYSIWGIPVVETTAAPATKALLGDYSNFSELAVRRGMDVQVSNSHSTYFTEGKLAMRADIRAALVHYRPKAFAEVTGL